MDLNRFDQIKDLKGASSIRAIHFWIGSSCDATISGAAALRAAELDSQVSATILSREAQERESPRFLSYFRQRLVIENLHFETPTCTMHRVSGITIPILIELEKVRWENFTSKDTILIDVHSRYFSIVSYDVTTELMTLRSSELRTSSILFCFFFFLFTYTYTEVQYSFGSDRLPTRYIRDTRHLF